MVYFSLMVHRNRKKTILFSLCIFGLSFLLVGSSIFAYVINAYSLVELKFFNSPVNLAQLVNIRPEIFKKQLRLPVLRAIEFDRNSPFNFQFYFDSRNFPSTKVKDINRGIRYFLGFLSIPQDKLWVNLSPYEKDRIIPEALANLDAGRDLLIEDYFLKQLTASLTDPKSNIGKKFWQEVYKVAEKIAGTTRIPINNFYKVWIVPDKAEVYEYLDTGKTIAFVKDAKLKVMMEEDYHNKRLKLEVPKIPKVNKKIQEEINEEAKEIFKRDLLPIIEEKVNCSLAFAPLRQMYYALILAEYMKENLRDKPLYRYYIDAEKIEFINCNSLKDVIYNAYYNNFYRKGHYLKSIGNGEIKQFFTGGIIPQVGNVMTKKSFKFSSFDPWLFDRVGVGLLVGQDGMAGMGAMGKNSYSVSNHHLDDRGFQDREITSQIWFIHKWVEAIIKDNPQREFLKSLFSSPKLLALLTGKVDSSQVKFSVPNLPGEKLLLIPDILNELFLELHCAFGRNCINLVLNHYSRVDDWVEMIFDINKLVDYTKVDDIDLEYIYKPYLENFFMQGESVKKPDIDKIKGIGIITRNRPDCLDESLSEILENICVIFEHIGLKGDDPLGKEESYFKIAIFDDSDTGYEEKDREIIERLSKQYQGYKIKIVHVDSVQKNIWKNTILLEGRDVGVFKEVLDETLKRSAGGNRNWVSLYFGDRPYIMMDDDVHPFLTVHNKVLKDTVFKHPFVRERKNGGRQRPVDFLGSLDRALQIDDVSVAFYEYGINKDNTLITNVLHNLSDHEGGELPDLLAPRKVIYHQEIKPFLGWQPPVGGMMAVKPNKVAPLTMPAVESYLRMEDFIVGIMQNWVFSNFTGKEHLLRMGGAIDHQKPINSIFDTKTDGKIASKLFHEVIGDRFLGLLLKQTIDKYLQEYPKEENLDIVLQKLAESLEKLSIRDIRDYNEMVFKAFQDIVSIYLRIKQHRDFYAKATILDSFCSLCSDIFKQDITKERVELENWIEDSANEIDRIIQTEVKAFSLMLRYWVPLFKAAQKTISKTTLETKQEQGDGKSQMQGGINLSLNRAGGKSCLSDKASRFRGFSYKIYSINHRKKVR